MKEPPKYIRADDGYQFALVEYVDGHYGPPTLEESGKKRRETWLGLYATDMNGDVSFSFCYYSKEGDFLGHHSPATLGESAEMALLEAWYEYKVAPYFWKEARQTVVLSHTGGDEFEKAYSKIWKSFSRAVGAFKLKERTRQMIYGDNDSKYDGDRLFYPLSPPRPNVATMEPIDLDMPWEDIVD